jgi:hypothetical protein
VFTKDGNTIYFTEIIILKEKEKKKQSRHYFNQNYKAKLTNGTWSNIEELPFNSDNYSTAHPALSTDEKHYTLHLIQNTRAIRFSRNQRKWHLCKNELRS